MKMAFFLLSLPVLVFSAPAPLAAAEGASKIAFVDMERIFREYHKTEIADAELKKQADVYKNYADTLADSLKKLQDEYKKLRDNAQNVALSEDEQEKNRLAARAKWRQTKAKESELVQYKKEKQLELKEKYGRMREGILAEIRDEIKKIAGEESLDIVFDSSGKTLNNLPGVIYYRADMDITDKVLARINRKSIEN